MIRVRNIHRIMIVTISIMGHANADGDGVGGDHVDRDGGGDGDDGYDGDGGE